MEACCNPLCSSSIITGFVCRGNRAEKERERKNEREKEGEREKNRGRENERGRERERRTAMRQAR